MAVSGGAAWSHARGPVAPWERLPPPAAALTALRQAVLDARATTPATRWAGLVLTAGPAADDGRPSRFRGRHLFAVRTGDATRASTRGPAGTNGPAGAEPTVEDDHREVWELVERARGGDGEAFGQIYDRYADVVYRYVFYRVNDRTLAEDLTSETFLRALRRIGSVTYQGRDIGAWFVTIARNLILDHVKSARSRLESTTDEIGLIGDHAASTVRPATPEALVLDALTSAALMTAVDALGLEQRECVLLRFVQGFSVSETAEIMGKNDGAIKALQHRAVRKLATLVGDSL